MPKVDDFSSPDADPVAVSGRVAEKSEKSEKSEVLEVSNADDREVVPPRRKVKFSKPAKEEVEEDDYDDYDDYDDDYDDPPPRRVAVQRRGAKSKSKSKSHGSLFGRDSGLTSIIILGSIFAASIYLIRKS